MFQVVHFTLLFLLTLTAVESVEKKFHYQFSIRGPHLFSAGPEVYRITREKKGGSAQDGWMIGIHGTYERLHHYGFYWAIDGYWAKGNIEGETRSGKILKSDLTDRQIEGRFGYSLCFPICQKLRFVPYGGYGSFNSINKFKKPSPIPFKSETNFDYWLGGIITLYDISSCWDMGINLKYKYPLEPKSKISDDPDYDDMKLHIGTEIHYEIEVPFRYYHCWRGKNASVSFTPFYRFRHYGEQENSPFDSIDTRFHIAGARCLFQVIF